MTLSTGVRRQADEAQRLQEEFIKSRNPESEEPEEPPQAPDGEPEPAPGAQADDDAPKESPETRDENYYKSRFEVMQGKYNAEVPRLNARIRSLEQELEQATQAPTPQAQPEAVDADFLTAEEREEFGDLAPIIAKVSSRIAEHSVKPVQEKVGEFEQARKREQAQQVDAAQTAFYNALAQQHPDWYEINTADAQFDAWLNQTVDPRTSKPYKQLANEAFARGDANAVAQFFTDWKAHQQAAQTPPPKRKVMPDTSAGNAPSTQPTVRPWTNGDIRRFYEDVRRDRYKGKEEEARAIEKEIAAAAAQGLVRQ